LFSGQLPEYSGPVAAGQPFPAFTTRQADGAMFTRDDLKGNRDNVLVFFRGRW
jgi:peroxiredoxin